MLELLGGGCYLLNKIFLWFSERSLQRKDIIRSRQWRIASWVIYLFGLPPWVIIYMQSHNWIAASVEASGAPAMLLGLVVALRGVAKKTPRWLDLLALICIPLGFVYSFYDFGGFNTANQWLEIGLVAGFLIGTYLLAKERSNGYLWFVLMHICCAWLMWRQDRSWLFWQQVVSLIFIIDAYRVTKKGERS